MPKRYRTAAVVVALLSIACLVVGAALLAPWLAFVIAGLGGLWLSWRLQVAAQAPREEA
jgi:hypothetical protein